MKNFYRLHRRNPFTNMRRMFLAAASLLIFGTIFFPSFFYSSNESRVVFAQTDTTQSASPNATPSGTPAFSPTPQATPPQRPIRELVRETPVPLRTRLIGLVGIAVLLGSLYLLSNNRRAVDWRVVVVGMILQVLIALFILRTAVGFHVFNWIGERVTDLLGFSNEGARFVFGRLVDRSYIEAISRNMPDPTGFVNSNSVIFAFSILPTIIFVAALFAVLYHLGVMQRVVYALAWVMARTMKSISGAEATTVAAEVFMGQTEAPLTIAPFIPRMTQSELLAMMIGGMGTVAGGVLAAYIAMGIDPVFLITTSVMSAPACLLCAKMLYPETEVPDTAGRVIMDKSRVDANIIDAAARGAGEGMRLAINVAAMLIAFIALVAMLNAMLGWFGDVTGINAMFGADATGAPRRLGLQLISGYIFAPLAFVMGVPAQDTLAVGGLFGTKLILNEFVAYLQLAPMQSTLHPRSVLIATYALCGFANIASMGIQIGGIGGLAPERRSDLARHGWRALYGGFVATCLTATIAGLLS